MKATSARDLYEKLAGRTGGGPSYGKPALSFDAVRSEAHQSDAIGIDHPLDFKLPRCPTRIQLVRFNAQCVAVARGSAPFA